ncbi:RHS repeat domain-containing protein [Thermaerobacter litoralis]
MLDFEHTTTWDSSYWYDANGNIVAIDTLSGRQTFEYDALNRLVRWTDETGKVTEYAYDAAGNLVRKGSETFTYDAANQIANPGFSYDANGNLTSDGTYRYEYDAENRLVKVTRVADGFLVAQYEYDYRGLRIRKVTPSGEVRYHWDSRGRLVRESDGSGKTLARYIWNDRDELVAIEKDGQVYYPHLGHRGDVLAVTDASGNRVVAYRYGPWGELLGQTGSFKQPWRYAGYYYDEETGLYYLKGRYYSPRLGRFLTKDPVLEFAEKKPLDPYAGFVALQDALADPQTLNPYTYARGNPVQYVDPDGRWANIVLGAAMGAFWAGLGYRNNTKNPTRTGLIVAVATGAFLGAVSGMGGSMLTTVGSRVAWTAYSAAKEYLIVGALTNEKLSVRGLAKNVGIGIAQDIGGDTIRALRKSVKRR